MSKNAASLVINFFQSKEKGDFLPNHVLLALVEIESYVDLWSKSGVDVTPFEDALPVWRKEAYHYLDPHSGRFANYAPSGNLGSGDVGVLYWVAERISTATPETTAEARDIIREMVDGAREAILGDKSLPERLCLHVLRLLNQVQDALDSFEVTGDFVLEDAIERLMGALRIVETVSEDPGRWAKFRDTWLVPFASQIAASGAVQGMAAITTGLGL